MSCEPILDSWRKLVQSSFTTVSANSSCQLVGPRLGDSRPNPYRVYWLSALSGLISSVAIELSTGTT
jgi:hypothetical protein